MAWRLAIDIGGTFTDLVALDEASGRIHLLKVRTTSEDPSTGFIERVDEIRAAAKISPAEISGVFHGTTVATNAILERKYDLLGLIVTGGYREVLECARQTVPGEFEHITTWIKPPRVVPLELVRETSARMDVAGHEVRPVDPDQIRGFAREFKQSGIHAIAVSLLHAYRDPAHEDYVRDLIAETIRNAGFRFLRKFSASIASTNGPTPPASTRPSCRCYPPIMSGSKQRCTSAG
jgi:N-methylhydantoinase A